MTDALDRAGRIRRALLALGLAAFLAPAIGGGGVTGTGYVAWGRVADFGSVFVNGIEFFTTAADVRIDGAGGQAESRLRVGMAVRVDGALDPDGRKGQASAVSYSADLRGTVDAAPVIAGEGIAFAVHGIAVSTDEATVFEGLAGPGALAAGERIEVSGLREGSTGLLRARFVSRRPLDGRTVVSGPAVASGPGVFTLGALQVEHAGGTIASGTTVRVYAAAAPSGGMLVAERVDVVDSSLGTVAGAEASAGGIVAGRSASGFTLGALAVRISGATRYRNGTAADLKNGEEVEAEGIVAADGALEASRVTFATPDRADAEGVVTAVTGAGFVVGIGGGVEVLVSAETRFKDRLRARSGSFGARTMRVGDRVSVAGREAGGGAILADAVTRTDPSANVLLAGRVHGTEAGLVSILGERVVAAPGALYADVGGAALTAEAFFAKAAGRRVKASGTASGDTLLATRLEIES